MLKFMDAYAEPLASLGDLYYHRYHVCIYMYVYMYVCMYVCMRDLWKFCGRLAEAMKHVFAMRLSLGDPAFSNTTGCTGSMLSDAYMAGEIALVKKAVRKT
jgi:hypothetical protein